eukprot:Skav208697  [mRNA]  locus=scaffold42:208920:209966:- [translate_table: standard]
MAARPSVQYIVVNTNECQFWQMLATMWMGHYWELSSSICPDMWWPRLHSNDWQSNQHNGEHPSCLGLHEPQADDKQTGAGTTPNFVVAGCDATEPDGCEELSGPHEPMIQTHKDENIPVTPAPRTDDFDGYLLEHSMQHFAAMACDADLQVDWNTNGAGTINLVDMTIDAVATASTCVPVTKLGGSIGQCCSNLAKPVGVDTSAFSSAMGIYGNGFLENQTDMLNANSDAGLPRALAEFKLGDRVRLHGLRTQEYNQKYGTIQTRGTADGRHGVRLSCGKLVSVKISNLKAVSSSAGTMQHEDDFSHFGPELLRRNVWSSGDCNGGVASESVRPFKFPPGTARPCNWP